MHVRWKRAGLIIGVTLGCFLLAAAGWGLYLYQEVKETSSQIYEPLERIPLTAADASLFGEASVSEWERERPGIERLLNTVSMHSEGEDTQDIEERTMRMNMTAVDEEAFTVLLMGVDERGKDRGRSDALILMAVHPRKEAITMIHIPRDTRTRIAGTEMEDKINHAYAFGGTSLAVATVEGFLGIPVDYYIRINMEGFEELVDLFGGVEVDNAWRFEYEGITFAQGKLHLDGKEALAYSRMRKLDPRGDLGRNARQKQILSALLEEGKSMQSLLKAQDMLNVVEQNVKTNLTFEDMKQLFAYRTRFTRLESDEIQGSGKMYNRIYYYVVSDKERRRIHDFLLLKLS
ncbi:LCP family glycopolymer transferase [Marinicrinis sediminis]|uniref:LCP family protein n=1 Tax=Marinicrinis sediminis TaxID=1652465 RepID=A0ABW5RDE8_9BACL